MWAVVALGLFLCGAMLLALGWRLCRHQRRVQRVTASTEYLDDPPPGFIKTHPESGTSEANLLDRRVVSYRTRSGKNLFTFALELVAPGQWRVFILGQPSYGSRPDDAHITHRLTDYASGRRYVCWDSPIRTADEALKIAVTWAEGTEQYIESGEHF